MRNFQLLFAVVLFAAFSSCKKQAAVAPQAPLPVATQNGSNTIAWTTSGENYVSNTVYGGILYDNPNTNAGYFVLQSSIVTGASYSRYVYLTTQSGTAMPIKVGTTYTMSGGSMLQESLNQTGALQQIQLQVSNGTFTITHFDPANQVISGTFTFSTNPSLSNGVPSRPSSGWFDLKYRLYTTDPNLYVGASSGNGTGVQGP